MKIFFFFSSRRRHTRWPRDWSSDVCSSDLEATKYTEVGYYGRDVESMVRDLVENAIGLVRGQELERVEPEAKRRVEERLLDMLAPAPQSFDVGVDTAESPERYERTREKMRAMLAGGEMESRKVEIQIEQKAHAM